MKLFKSIKNKETLQKDIAICTADNSKSECSLVQELRELQNKKDELCKMLSDSEPIDMLYWGYSNVEYRVTIDKDTYRTDKKSLLELLKRKIAEEEKYLVEKEEIEVLNKQIEKIKQQLGIK